MNPKDDLPADLVAPLHLPDPYPHPAWLWLAALLLLALLWTWWRRSRRRRAQTTPWTPPPPAPAAAASGISAAIDEILHRYKDTDRRQGCHRLSETLRVHLETKTRKRCTTFTVREIATELGDQAVAAFFELLRDLQFGRREPSRSNFEGICEMATAVASRAGGKPSGDKPSGGKGTR